MALTERLAQPPVKIVPNVLDKWLDGLNATDREAVTAAVLDPAWRHVDLQEALTAEGAPTVASTTFGVWRKRQGWKP